MAANIITLGSINTDLVIRGSRLPATGETVLGGSFYQAQGGKGANQAVAAARAAGKCGVIFVAAVGTDAFGEAGLAELNNAGIDTRHVKTVSGQPTGVALILVDEQGENLISVASGANAHLLVDDIDAVPEGVFQAATVFLVCLESPPPPSCEVSSEPNRPGC